MRVPLDSRVHAAHSSNINHNIRLHSHSIIKFKKTNWIPCSNSSIPVDSDYSNRFYSAEVVLIPTRWTQRHITVVIPRIPHQTFTLTSSPSSALGVQASAVVPHLAVTPRHTTPFLAPCAPAQRLLGLSFKLRLVKCLHTKRVLVLKELGMSTFKQVLTGIRDRTSHIQQYSTPRVPTSPVLSTSPGS